MTETVLWEQRGHIAQLILNNPQQHNAVGQAELDGLARALADVAANPQLRVLVLTGAGEKTFCAGASLDQVGSGDLAEDNFRAVTDQIAQMAIPTICALNGSVYGFGVELALSCDFRVGIQGSRMRVPAAAIGICYTASGIQRVVQHLGLVVARRVLVAAEQFEAEDMLHIGFLDHLVLPAQLQAFTAAFAGDMAELAPLAVRAMKELVGQAAAAGIDPERAAELVRQCAASEDIKEGLAARGEKRKPDSAVPEGRKLLLNCLLYNTSLGRGASRLWPNRSSQPLMLEGNTYYGASLHTDVPGRSGDGRNRSAFCAVGSGRAV